MRCRARCCWVLLGGGAILSFEPPPTGVHCCGCARAGSAAGPVPAHLCSLALLPVPSHVRWRASYRLPGRCRQGGVEGVRRHRADEAVQGPAPADAGGHGGRCCQCRCAEGGVQGGRRAPTAPLVAALAWRGIAWREVQDVQGWQAGRGGSWRGSADSLLIRACCIMLAATSTRAPHHTPRRGARTASLPASRGPAAPCHQPHARAPHSTHPTPHTPCRAPRTASSSTSSRPARWRRRQRRPATPPPCACR